MIADEMSWIKFGQVNIVRAEFDHLRIDIVSQAPDEWCVVLWKIRDGFAKDQIFGMVQTFDGYLGRAPACCPFWEHRPSNFATALLACIGARVCYDEHELAVPANFR